MITVKRDSLYKATSGYWHANSNSNSNLFQTQQPDFFNRGPYIVIILIR